MRICKYVSDVKLNVMQRKIFLNDFKGGGKDEEKKKRKKY